jgi:hypothetical protein
MTDGGPAIPSGKMPDSSICRYCASEALWDGSNVVEAGKVDVPA